jgi:hypothetical protein
MDWHTRKVLAWRISNTLEAGFCVDPRTQAYVARRIASGNSKLEAIRSLKHYIAREVFGIIMRS